MADSTSNIPQMSSFQAAKEVTFNSVIDALSPASIFGRNFATSSGLVWGFLGGRIEVDAVPTLIANGTLTLTASTTCYIEATRAGVVSSNTTAFTPGRVPLYVVVTGSASATSWQDVRQPGAAVCNRAVVNITNANVTLTAAQARCQIIEVTGTLNSSHRSIIVPLALQQWTIFANTAGGVGVNVIGATGTGVTVADGHRAIVYSDGTNVVRVTADV